MYKIKCDVAGSYDFVKKNRLKAMAKILLFRFLFIPWTLSENILEDKLIITILRCLMSSVGLRFFLNCLTHARTHNCRLNECRA